MLENELLFTDPKHCANSRVFEPDPRRREFALSWEGNSHRELRAFRGFIFLHQHSSLEASGKSHRDDVRIEADDPRVDQRDRILRMRLPVQQARFLTANGREST